MSGPGRNHPAPESEPAPDNQSVDPAGKPSADPSEASIPAAPPLIEATPTPAGTSPPAAQQMEHLKKRLEEKDAQIKQVMNAYRKLKKDAERARERSEKHQRRVFERSKTDFITRFIEVLDNIDRAITAVENNFDSDSVLQGIILVRSRLVQLLREEGLEKIFVEGQPFDPTHSEAAAIEPVDNEADDNIVTRELQRGYKIRGTLLRPARVVVGRRSLASGAEGPAPPAAEGAAPPFPEES